jgi:hypothetical protein
MADNTLFSGLKRLIFKDVPETEVPAPVPPPPVPETRPAGPAVAATTPPALSGWDTVSDSGTDETIRAKAYQLLESINQPGVDFMEVWNATTESGGPSGLKAAFNALKYADKTLTREKVLTTGRFYIDRLQKALTADLEKKRGQQAQLEAEKAAQHRNLTDTLSELETQLATLQKALVEKREALAGLETQYASKLQELEQKTHSGKTTIESLLQQMHNLLQAAEREL